MCVRVCMYVYSIYLSIYRILSYLSIYPSRIVAGENLFKKKKKNLPKYVWTVSNAPGQLGFQLPPLQHLLIHLALELHHLADAKVGIVGTLRGYKWYRNGIYIYGMIPEKSWKCHHSVLLGTFSWDMIWYFYGRWMGLSWDLEYGWISTWV